MKSTVCALLITPVLCSGVLADAFPGIEALMKEEAFKAAGLDKLSAEEIHKLNQWLIHYTAVEAPIVKNNAAVAKVAKEESRKVIHSAIDGEFNGWTGKTVFRLHNGQVWEQRYSGKWIVKLDSPKVVIRRNFMGYYQMEVIDNKRIIGVRRIQ